MVEQAIDASVPLYVLSGIARFGVAVNGVTSKRMDLFAGRLPEVIEEGPPPAFFMSAPLSAEVDFVTLKNAHIDRTRKLNTRIIVFGFIFPPFVDVGTFKCGESRSCWIITGWKR
jgi:hypothetical protein